MIFQQFVAYGFFGLVIENIFTGLWSLLHGDKRTTTTSYLWMIFIYGLGGLQMQTLHGLGWNPFLLALIYVPVIYVNEFCWGLFLDKLLGKCPWDYGRGRHTIMGYIRIDYAPLWFLLALGFELSAGWVQKALNLLSTVGA